MATVSQDKQPPEPKLDALPEELISNVCVKLGSDDIFAFRLTCKALEAKSFHEFATEYYHQKCFIFSSYSLKVLLGIARSERLRPYLVHVYFAPTLYSERVFKCCEGAKCVWQPTVRQTEAARWHIHDQQELKKSGRDLEMITEAFKLLTNVTSLVFTDGACKNIDIPGLYRSVRTMKNTPYTLPTHPKDKEYYRFKNHVWKTLLCALGDSAISTIKQFSTDLDVIKNALSISANLELSPKIISSLEIPFGKLSSLALQISSCKQSKLGSTEEDDGIDTVRGAQVMQRFAGVIPALKHLSLTFSFSPSSAILATNFMNNIELHNLTKLQLTSVYMDVHSLGLMLCNLPALEDLQLVWVNLTEGTWTTILAGIRLLKKLRHLHLMDLNEGHKPAFFLQQLSVEGDIAQEPPFDLAFDGPAYGYVPADNDYDDDTDEDTESEYYLPEGTDEGGVDIEGHSESELESLPDLIPQEEAAAPATHPSMINSSANPPPSNTHKTHKHGTTPTYDSEDSTPSFGEGPNRGTQICLNSAEQIREHIPTFIKEYNLGPHPDDDPLGPGGLGAPPAFNAFLNSLGAAIGMGPPTNVVGNAMAGGAVFMGPPMGANVGGGAAATGGTGAGGAGNAGGQQGGAAGGGGTVPTNLAFGGMFAGFPQPPPPPPPPQTANTGSAAVATAGGANEEDDGWDTSEYESSGEEEE
ncbi:hypothetical protein LTR37_015354 [Vermiconidia calcicola]|uniref:Uncharacterized protein n=1 Tax=Vermiconidia calcicola TaxID=1690605 RepID=A0ACC3MRR9_9PEZI|nr:hypothetical protein LTR37_015354 [Vermiconidia calcicola]